LPDELKNAANEEARKKSNALGLIANTRSSIEPFLTFSSRRDLRQKAFEIFTSRGDNDNANNNNAILVQILKLRLEKAKLLGFKTFCRLEFVQYYGKNSRKHYEFNDVCMETSSRKSASRC
jgi:peptidyl-dipeptidase Dcp